MAPWPSWEKCSINSRLHRNKLDAGWPSGDIARHGFDRRHAGGIAGGIRNVPDFPEEGIQFKDITPVLADARLLDGCISHLLGGHSADTVDVVAGIDARGFIFGAAMARELGVGFVPIRKKWQVAVGNHRGELRA